MNGQDGLGLPGNAVPQAKTVQDPLAAAGQRRGAVIESRFFQSTGVALLHQHRGEGNLRQGMRQCRTHQPAAR